MKYSVKIIIRRTVETGERFLEESILMLDAASSDEAYLKAEKYVKENEICAAYDNMYGKRVHSEIVSYADCFSVYDDESIVEVYSSVRRCKEKTSEKAILSVLEKSCLREDMLSLRKFADPDRPEESESFSLY